MDGLRHLQKQQERGGIVRIMVLELKDQDSPIFDKIMEVVKCCPDIEYIKITLILKNETTYWKINSKPTEPCRTKKYRNPLKGCGMYEKHIFSCSGRHNACPLCMAYDS